MTQIKTLATNGSSLRVTISNIAGFQGKKITGIENIDGGGIVNELAMARGAGGGFNKDFTGEGFLSVSPITLKLWYTTFCEYIQAIGGYDNYNTSRAECTIDVYTTFPGNTNPTLHQVFKRCRPTGSPMSFGTSQVENILVDVTFQPLTLTQTVG